MNPLTWAAVAAVINVGLVAGCGFFLRCRGIIKKQAESSIVGMLVDFLMPCLIFSKVSSSKEFTSLSDVAIPLCVPLLYAPLLLCVCHFISGCVSRNLLPDMTARRSFSISCYLQNFGYLPLTLLMVLDPEDRFLGTLFVHNTGVEIVMWLVTTAYLSGGKNVSLGKIINPPVLAVFAGIIVNLLDITPLMPSVLMSAISRVGTAAVPIGIMMVGVTICGILEDKKGGFSLVDAKLAMLGSFLRLVCFPPVIIAIATLSMIPDNLKAVLAIQCAMPSAVFGLILVRFYGGKPEYSLPAVLATTLLSILTTPLWINAAVNWLGVNF